MRPKVDRPIGYQEVPGGVHRARVPEAQLARLDHALRGAMERRIAKYGHGVHASPHEVVGILKHEVESLLLSVQAEDREDLDDRLRWLIVSAMWSLASLWTWTQTEEEDERLAKAEMRRAIDRRAEKRGGRRRTDR